ncbi:amino acid ABC transporter permease [Microbacterium lacticum]|uniref:Glutamate transport system permease protein n=1 Tax=Microbacterium lacticum TaxID=33885 RepID=A0A4Y3UNA8_9MICO|nr:amino acid ABC transporter permease [Microbacterium lacticum]TQM99993.1 glutamate transport system permease protein [Microbacterium lacticum]GEB94999.1 amino acid ABC transporter permease [Microbacterium lacticum]GGN20659.1 amino acid ABC transporter permease [Microbacterium lacticum]
MGVITDHLDLWGQALQGTLILFFGGGLIALVLGLIVGAMRVSPVPVARAVGTVYVSWIRNTPLTLVMFFFAFCVPILLRERIDPIVLPTIALGVYTATYVAETLRSGINTVPVGQAEAARALGLTFTQVMTLVVLPQATRSVIPPMMSVFIALLKNTTVAAGFSVLNLGSIRSWLSEQGENQLVVLLWVMLIFIVLVLLLAWLQRVFENRWRVAR